MGNERALHTEPTGVVREGGQSSSKEDSAGVCEGKSLLPEGGIRNIRWWKQSFSADTEKNTSLNKLHELGEF